MPTIAQSIQEGKKAPSRLIDGTRWHPPSAAHIAKTMTWRVGRRFPGTSCSGMPNCVVEAIRGSVPTARRRDAANLQNARCAERMIALAIMSCLLRKDHTLNVERPSSQRPSWERAVRIGELQNI